ncbi:MAG: DoxX family protein [Verrucomicrobiae bacterium]|nr:DoxX family protein [Verrucomicrobiae bacterium]MCP5549671.1 DoxX family protein [Akkermansiaceae bacterium]
MKKGRLLELILRLAAAGIFAQTLFYKFTGAPESVEIFSKLGVEPWGRWAAGVSELVAAILLLTPRFAWCGAALGLGVIGGAILSHLFVLGIEIQGDGGLLFALAVIVFACCAVVLWRQRRKLPVIGPRFP